MIFSALNRCCTVEAFIRRLQKGIDFLKHSDFSNMAAGRYELDEDMYFLVQQYTTKSCEQAKFEAHRRYADIQYIVSGQEWMDCCELADAVELTPFDELKDCGKYSAKGTVNSFRVRAGQFAVFLPQDCHKPSYHPDNEPASSVVKVVLKIRI